jgi:hypothetical protein
MNVGEQYAQVLLDKEEEYVITESAHETYQKVFALFNIANQRINEVKKVFTRTTSQVYAAATTTFKYSKPAQLVNQAVPRRAVLVKLGDGTLIYPRQTDMEQSVRRFGDLSNANATTGIDIWWFPDDDPDKIAIGWPAGESGTLTIRYVAKPRALTSNALYDPDTTDGITFTVTNGATTVALAGGASIPAGSLPLSRDGNTTPLFEIGLGTAAEPPNEWHRVASVTLGALNIITAMTLAEAWDQETQTSAFQCAQVSDVERHTNSVNTGILPVWYALGRLQSQGDLNHSTNWMKQFDAALLTAGPSVTSIDLSGSANPAPVFPHLARPGIG